MKIYEHKAQYYETDQMGIVHHSNYIRWMEEARIAMLEEMGISYKKMEADGITIPVIGVTCEYKGMVRFYDVVCIDVTLKQYNGIRMTLSYRITDKETGELRTLGESSHCFLNRAGCPVSLKLSYPEWDQLFQLFR